MPRLRSKLVLGFAAGLLLAFVSAPDANAADGREALDFALRRAAYELASGRPADAQRVLERLRTEDWNGNDERVQIAALLHAEATLLAGHRERARAAFDQLAEAPNDFVRAQVAGHRLALDGLHSDSTGVEATHAWLARAWLQNAGGYSKRQRADAAAGDLLAALVLLRVGDAAGVDKALEQVKRGGGRGVALALRAEQALALSEFDAADKYFEQLRELNDVLLETWLSDWAAMGGAVSAARSGREDDARRALATVRDVDLLPYARVLGAQLDWRAGNYEAARAALSDPALEAWTGKVAVEAALLLVQVELDAGRFEAAEAHAAALVDRLPEWLGINGVAHALQPELRVDLGAWHTSRTRATLARLAELNVMRESPELARLARSTETLVLLRPGAVDTTRAYMSLLRPFHEVAPVLEQEEPTRDAARNLLHSRYGVLAAQSDFDLAARRLAERRALLERALAALREHDARLDEALRQHAQLAGRLNGYRDALTAQEAEWLRTLQDRVRVLREGLAHLEHAVSRLDARFPDDRSVRLHADVDKARASMSAARQWIAAVDSLERDLQRRVPSRVHEVLHQLEPEQAAEALSRLAARIDSLRLASARLAAALAEADTAERTAYARTRNTLAQALAITERARSAYAMAWDRLESEYASDVEAHRRIYLETARDAEATAAFLAAVEGVDSTVVDVGRLARLEHAATVLQSFVTDHPRAQRADEMWYRLGETHVQRAAVEHRAALSHYLSAGGDVSDVPVPVENYADALDAYAALLEHHPTSPRVAATHLQMGFLMAELAAPQASAEHLERFLALVPADDERRGNAALRLGEDYLDLADRERAYEAYALAAQVADPQVRHLGLYKMAWCAYDLDRNDAARRALRQLLGEVHVNADLDSKRLELAAEALELLALSFTADHQASETVAVLDAWGRPHYEFALLRRMAQLFTSRALYDESIQTWEVLLARHPLHPHAAGAAAELLRVVEVHEGASQAHALAAQLAPRFAPGADWSQQTRDASDESFLKPVWQSRLLEEDHEVARADSVALALARPDVAATHMARRLRRAAVYAHQRARTDSLARSDGLVEATRLYERALELFPNAEDESTTWLYLGEARFELARFGAAADAYATAAAHADADSSIRARGAALELAALDAASELDAQWLERYDRVTRHYLQQNPNDARGFDALERVGSLAFAGGSYEQAENAYGDLARVVPDRRRAAAALKVVGDTWWQREEFDRAAEQYETALARARAARADSLSLRLEVLVPGAVYRAAGAAETDGNARGAAERFERVAQQHPQFEFADQALYRAARMRAADGDTSQASQDLEFFVRDFRGSELHPDALLELAALQNATGEHARAAQTYRQLAIQHPRHAQARTSRLAAGELFERAGDPSAADGEYRVVLDSLKVAARSAEDSTLVANLWMRRARLAPSLEDAAPHYESALSTSAHLPQVDRAEALFQLTERQRPQYESVTLTQPLDESLARKKTGLEIMLRGYKSTLEAGVEPWHAAASLRLGECLVHLGSSLQTSEPPPGLGESDLVSYRQALAGQASALEGRAVETWSTGLRAARAAALEDDWRRGLEGRLYPALTRRTAIRPAPYFVLVQPE